MLKRVDVRMSASVDSEEEEEKEVDATARVCPSVKANLLFAAPQSHLLAPLHFKSKENTARLVKFLKRTKMIDVSLKVLSVHYTHFTECEHLCGKIVYNQMAQLLMMSRHMVEHSLKPVVVPMKDIVAAKSLLGMAQKIGTKNEDFEFL